MEGFADGKLEGSLAPAEKGGEKADLTLRSRAACLGHGEGSEAVGHETLIWMDGWSYEWMDWIGGEGSS